MPQFLVDNGGAIAALVLVLSGVLGAVIEVRRGRRAAAASQSAFDVAAKEAVTAIEQSLPDRELNLDDEVADVSNSLAATLVRLRHVSEKAQAFEAEVKQLVARADAARATAKLHEEDARQIALLLGSETENRFKEEINKLTIRHGEQIEWLRKSSN
jgi:hypothetical protein